MEDLFEEVVGEIDEGQGRTPIIVEAPGRLSVRGTVRLEEAGAALGRNLDHAKVTTISGLVLTLLGRPAVTGDSVVWNNARIDVTATAGRGVADALVMFPDNREDTLSGNTGALPT